MSISRTDTTRTTGIQSGLRTGPGSSDFSSLSQAANDLSPGSVAQAGQQVAPDGDQLAYCLPCVPPAIGALESALGWTILGTGAVVGGATIMENRRNQSSGTGRNNGGEDRSEHTKGKRNSTKDKHTKPRAGRTTTKQRSKPGWFQR